MLTDKELDAVIRTEPAAAYELPQTDGTAASIREALRLIARNAEREAEREAYKRAAAECRALAQKYQTFGRTMPSQASRLLYVSMNAGVLNAAAAIEALGREE